MGATVVRHTCHRCGGSCQGPGAPVTPDEAAGLRTVAASLEVPDPVEGDRLRTREGRCVFLQQDNLCAVELHFGRDTKPAWCRTWPLVFGAGGLLGVDPGCLTATVTARSGPVVGTVDPSLLPHPELRERLDGTLASALARLCGGPAVVGRPPESQRAWLVAHLDAVLDVVLSASRPPGHRNRVRHLGELRGRTDPSWPPSPELDAHALDVARAMVALDRVPGRPAEQVALDTLRGAALCAWAGPELNRFAPALAAWSRMQRDPALLAVFDLP
jgi:hypothetical protein